MELKQKIENIMKDAKPWQRVPTSIDGAYLIKAPSRGDQETLMVEFNPLDSEGRPIKRRGIFISNVNQLELFKDLMNQDKVKHLLGALPNKKETATKVEI